MHVVSMLWQHVFFISVFPLIFVGMVILGGKNQWEWRSATVLMVSIVLWAFFIGRWDMVGYYFRYLLLVVAVIGGMVGSRQIGKQPDPVPRGRLFSFPVMFHFGLAVVFASQAIWAIAGMFPPKNVVDLVFPLRGESYYIAQGGGTAVVNYHVAHPSQSFALDIVRINPFGYRARGLYPRALELYAIYEDEIHSPCAGTVIASRDGLIDHFPPHRDQDNPEGNYVAVRCGDVDVYLAHMRQGSVRVRVGDHIEVGQLIGRVGNSGNTTEPHLHMHVQRSIDSAQIDRALIGVPMRFEGRFLVRNSLFTGNIR